MTKMRGAMAILLGLVIGLGVGVTVSQTFRIADSWSAPLGGHQTTMASGEGLIVFTSGRSGAQEIWVMRSDGAFATQLTRDGGWKSRIPQVSMDGRWIVYAADPAPMDFVSDVFVMGIDGSNLTQISDASARGHSYWHATWHPSGRSILVNNRNDSRIHIIDVGNPPYTGATAPRRVEPGAPTLTPAGGPYSDWVGDVGSGGMVVLSPKRDEFWDVRNILVDDANHVMVYTQSDACYQCDNPATCGLANFPVTIALSSNPTAHMTFDKSPQLISPEFFGAHWTGETGSIQLQFGDTRRDDNCGSATLWLIPYPTGD